MSRNTADHKYGTLKKYFGYDGFRPGQEELIDALLAGRDVLGIMPTRSRKVDLLSASGSTSSGDYSCDLATDFFDEGSGACFK